MPAREVATDQGVRAAYGRLVPTITASAEVSVFDSTNPMRGAFDNTADVTLALTDSWAPFDGGDLDAVVFG